MKWFSKPTIRKQGQWRTVVKFAWIPTRLTLPDKKVVVWLERYRCQQRLDKECDYFGTPYLKWYTHQRTPVDYGV